MKKQTIYVLVAILIVSIQNECAAQKIKLLKKTHLANYPSASSLEFYGDKLYVIGDDAPSVWILDNQHQIIDSILLFPSKEKRIDPAIKADLESSTIFPQNNKTYLVSLSSFSTDTRNKIIFFDLSGKEITTKIVEANPKINVEELNIEGAASYNNQVILSNRANATHKNNSLIITSLNLETGINEINNKLITLRLPKTKMVVGISGLTYIKNKDLLVFSASTEDTPNAYTDGKIGGSYIGYIKNISGKLDDSSVKIDKLISISKFLKEKVAQKIESITVEKIAGKRAVVHLAADNDNGESTLFKLSIRL
jgi:hypothetical protein